MNVLGCLKLVGQYIHVQLHVQLDGMGSTIRGQTHKGGTPSKDGTPSTSQHHPGPSPGDTLANITMAWYYLGIVLGMTSLEN